jgi:hypothetical protein
MMEKILIALQSRLVELEATELEEITKQSQDEAVRLAILLAGQPAPPMPEFELDSKYKDAEKLADAVDDVFGSLDSSKDDFKNDKEPWENYDDTEYPSSKKSAKVEPSETLTDAEALKLCSEWKEKYSVVVGVSWGNLPYDLQQRWLKISCDYHFANDKDKEGK